MSKHPSRHRLTVAFATLGLTSALAMSGLLFSSASAAPVQDTATTTAGTPVTIDVTTNDTFGFGLGCVQFPGACMVSSASGDHGTWTVAPNNYTVTYSPEAGFTGTAMGTYSETALGPNGSGTIRVTVSAPQAGPGDGVGHPIRGTRGPDVIYGTSGDDIIYGRGGNDTIYGLGGNDTLIGGRGNDTLDGGAGADKLYGNAGNDKLLAADGSADSVINGGKGVDRAQFDATDPKTARVP